MPNENHSETSYTDKRDPRLDTEKGVDHLHAPSHEVGDDCPACEPEQERPLDMCPPDPTPPADFDIALHSLASALARETRPEVRRKMIMEAVDIMNRGIAPPEPVPAPVHYEPPGHPAAPAQSFGDYVVGRDFNPSGRADVNEVKGATGHLIDFMHQIRKHGHGEQGRLASLAITAYEEACMWAVKALTKGPR